MIGLTTVALALSVTRIANEKMPDADGVPLRIPVAGSSVRPGGKVPESSVQAKGGLPPEAVNVTE